MNQVLNILLAEDEPSNQLLMQKMLALAGHKVTIAENGQEALDCLKENPYDICIFDMQMPVMTGIEAIVKYKTENSESKTPFIMLTGNTEKYVIEECLEAGVAMYLAKPVKPKQLLDAISYVLSHDEPEHGKIEENSVIDITQLHNYKDQHFLDEFIETFKLSADKFSVNLNNSLNDDHESFKIATHSIKGLAANIGAQVLRDISYEAEYLSPEQYEKHSEEYSKKIITELVKAREELIKYSSKQN